MHQSALTASRQPYCRRQESVIEIFISVCFAAGALLHSKHLTKQQLLQDKAVAAADASGQAAIAAATSGHKAAAMRMKQKLAQLAPTKGMPSDRILMQHKPQRDIQFCILCVIIISMSREWLLEHLFGTFPALHDQYKYNNLISSCVKCRMVSCKAEDVTKYVQSHSSRYCRSS